MCVAIVKPAGVKLPSRDIFKICFKNNPDGAGFAYCRNGRNYIQKGFFTFAHFWKAFTQANIKKSEAALIHFRVATHGNIDKHTCHPFVITSDYDDMRKTNVVTSNGDVMVHNGMLNFHLDNNNISDSMYLAKYLSNYDLNDEINSYMFELALLNNNKSKMNRVGILKIDNTVEIYGFKEPWENVDGCLFSNKSYKEDFSRSNVCITNKDSKSKLDYDENEIQSKKISFCYNHKFNSCNELGVYIVYNDEKNYDLYCEDCIDDVNYFNCEYCGNTYYDCNKSSIENICTFCYNKHSEFIVNKKCETCDNVGKHILFSTDKTYKNSIILCDKCFNMTKPFKCAECSKWFSDIDESHVKGLCKECEKNRQSSFCTFCNSRMNLIKTNYSVVCEKCFKEKNGKICFICDKKFIYGNNSIGNFDICPNCSKSNSTNEIVLDNFKSFQMLRPDIRFQLVNMFKEASIETKIDIMELYKYNNYFDQIKENANNAKKIMLNS